jgi:hypothetical protein
MGSDEIALHLVHLAFGESQGIVFPRSEVGELIDAI